MNLKEFRATHSIVMEHYQFIEMHLEGIYAALSGRSFYEGLKEAERYNISRIIIMIQEQENRRTKEGNRYKTVVSGHKGCRADERSSV